MTVDELGARADLAAARCRVALGGIEAGGGVDVAAHLQRLRWSLFRAGTRRRGSGHRDPDRIERTLAAIAAGGVDAHSFGELGAGAQRALERDLTRLSRVLPGCARIGAAAAPTSPPPAAPTAPRAADAARPRRADSGPRRRTG